MSSRGKAAAAGLAGAAAGAAPAWVFLTESLCSQTGLSILVPSWLLVFLTVFSPQRDSTAGLCSLVSLLNFPLVKLASWK